MQRAVTCGVGWCVVLACLTALAVGCDRGQNPGQDSPGAAPSASVIAIANALGTCDDLALCDRECDAGSSDRCRLGVNYEFGKGVEKDGVHATALYERSCGMGNVDACVSAGRMYEFHHGVAKDDAKATGYYTRACDLGDPTGCANLAVMLENGRGVPKDLPRAAALYQRACDKGAGLACERAHALRNAAEAGAGAGAPDR